MRMIQFLEDDRGTLSSTRLGFLMWTLGVLGVWLYASLKDIKLAEIPESVIILVGALMAGKVAQKVAEKSPKPE